MPLAIRLVVILNRRLEVTDLQPLKRIPGTRRKFKSSFHMKILTGVRTSNPSRFQLRLQPKRPGLRNPSQNVGKGSGQEDGGLDSVAGWGVRVAAGGSGNWTPPIESPKG